MDIDFKTREFKRPQRREHPGGGGLHQEEVDLVDQQALEWFNPLQCVAKVHLAVKSL